MKATPCEKLARIILVDDHPIVRAGLRQLINQEADLEICGEARDSREALDLVAAEKPDLAIVDISLPGRSGLELIKTLTERHPALFILVLSIHDESLYAERSLLAGAKGYLRKEAATEHVIEAIHSVLAGGVYLSQQQSAELLSKLANRSSKDTSDSELHTLSDRELEVFELIGHGFGSRQIADRLQLSIKTIDAHREKIKRRLRIRSAPELVMRAVQWVHSDT